MAPVSHDVRVKGLMREANGMFFCAASTRCLNLNGTTDVRIDVPLVKWCNALYDPGDRRRFGLFVGNCTYLARVHYHDSPHYRLENYDSTESTSIQRVSVGRRRFK